MVVGSGKEVMDDTLCVYRGEWKCSENGSWKFVATQGEMARCVSIETVSCVKDLITSIGNLYSVKRSEIGIGISSWYPDEKTVFTTGKTPPLSISSDVEFAQFKKKRNVGGGRNLYVTLTKLSCIHGEVMGRNSEDEWDDPELLAKVDEVEGFHRNRMEKRLEIDGSGERRIGKKRKDTADSVDNNRTEVVWRTTSIGKRIGMGQWSNKVDKLGATNVTDNTCDVVDMFSQSSVMDNITQSVVDERLMSVDINTDNVDKSQIVDNSEVVDKSPFVDNSQVAEKSAVVENSDVLDKSLVVDISQVRGKAHVEDDSMMSEEDEEDYDFDEWTERINDDYPLEWDPYPEWNMHGSGGSLCDRGESLGDDIPVSEHIGGVGPICNNNEDDFMVVGSALINGSDPLLLEDAPPFHDNMRGAPSEERNMDLKRGSDSIFVGRVFANKAELRKILSVYAMKRLFTYRIGKSDKSRVIVTCVDKNCGWRIYATTHPNSVNVEIKTVSLKHNCDVAARSRYGEKASAKILAELFQAKFANGRKGPRACELPSMVLQELNVTISYMKAWNLKELAIQAARGNEEENYRFLSTYFHLVKETNPGTISDMHTSVEKKSGKTLFKYLFFAFGASITGYKNLRKVIVIDGTTLKGKYKGCLVAASGQDGNLQIYPLGFGVVEKENDAGWSWFFKNLQKFVPDEKDLVFVSDRHTSIYSALAKVYPLAYHATCLVHICRNVRGRFHCESLSGIVSKAGKAFTIGDFRYWWKEIERRNQKCADYLLEIGLPHWTLSHFPGNRYNLMSSNISESLNAALQQAVDYPIVSMVEFIRTMMMRWFWCRRTLADKTRSKCTPEIEEMLLAHLSESTDCGVLSVSNWVYQVNDGNGCVFTVDLEKKTCTCRVFDILKIPCCHALSACRVRHVDIYTLVDQCYFVGPWRKMYESLIMPVPNVKDSYIPAVVTDGAVDPPKTARGGGRPKKKRIPSKGEVNHVKKRKTPAKCGRCFGTGHNKKTCSVLI